MSLHSEAQTFKCRNKKKSTFLTGGGLENKNCALACTSKNHIFLSDISHGLWKQLRISQEAGQKTQPTLTRHFRQNWGDVFQSKSLSLAVVGKRALMQDKLEGLKCVAFLSLEGEDIQRMCLFHSTGCHQLLLLVCKKLQEGVTLTDLHTIYTIPSNNLAKRLRNDMDMMSRCHSSFSLMNSEGICNTLDPVLNKFLKFYSQSQIDRYAEEWTKPRFKLLSQDISFLFWSLFMCSPESKTMNAF